MTDPWANIKHEPSKVIAKRSRLGSKIWWARSGKNAKQLRVDQPKSNPDEVTPDFHGVKLEDRDHCLVIELADSSVEDIFSTLCVDLESEAFESADPRTLVINRLNHWSDLLKRQPDGLPPLQQQGLFGELVFISKQLELGRSPMDAVNSWSGPNHLHDFNVGDAKIEVKTYLSHAGSGEVRIKNEDQLNPVNTKNLSLFTVGLLKDSDGATTLTEFLSDVQSVMNDANASEVLLRKARLSGFDASRQRIPLERFECTHTDIFAVSADFPSLHSGIIPSAVRSVQYRLSIEELRNWSTSLNEVLQS